MTPDSSTSGAPTWVDKVTAIEPPDSAGQDAKGLSSSKRLVSGARWLLVAIFWCAFLAALVLGLASLAVIFTGDETYGALDGFQFVSALYTAVFRFLLAAVALWLVVKLARWSPRP